MLKTLEQASSIGAERAGLKSLHTLDALAEKSQSEKLKNAFTQLEGILFKNYPSKPDTRPLLAELKQLREKATKVEKQTALAPLYPSSI